MTLFMEGPRGSIHFRWRNTIIMLKGCPATPTLPYIAHTKRKTFFAEKERCVCSSFLSIVLQHTFPQLSGKVFLCCLKVHITSASKKRLHNIVLHWKFWWKYRSVSYWFSCNNQSKCEFRPTRKQYLEIFLVQWV